MLRNIILLCIFSTAFCLDLPDVMVEMFRQNVDHKADPCDDFYRHACPRGLSYANTFSGKTEKLLNEYEILKNFTNDEINKRHEKQLSKEDEYMFLNEFNDLCQNDKQGTSKFLKKLKKHISHVNEECKNTNCFSNLMKKSCKRAGASILDILKNLPKSPLYKEGVIEYIQGRKGYYLLKAMKKRNVSEKVERSFVELVDDSKNIAIKWMNETPWMINNDIKERHQNVAKSIKVKGFQEMIDELEPFLPNYDLKLSDCDKEFEDIPSVIPFICHVSVIVLLKNDMYEKDAPYWYSNAHNRHPYLVFSAPYFLISQKSKHNSSVIGAAGRVVAHEVSHSIIVTEIDFHRLTYFSKPAEDCIEAQFNKSCAYFKEASCNPIGKLEENGADILAWSISYEYLTRKLGDDLYKKVPGLSITNQQMYFYSAAFSSCYGSRSGDDNDSHTASNARINTMVQLPEFKKAFECEDNSRMMQSRAKQCFILGEKAPERKIFNNSL